MYLAKRNRALFHTWTTLSKCYVKQLCNVISNHVPGCRHTTMVHNSHPVIVDPSCLQTTEASGLLQLLWHTVPQPLLMHTSTLPSYWEVPPTSWTSPCVQVAASTEEILCFLGEVSENLKSQSVKQHTVYCSFISRPPQAAFVSAHIRDRTRSARRRDTRDACWQAGEL